MSINKTLFQQKLDALKRAGNERRFKELQSKYQSPEAIDYSNMSLRDELQTRFDLDELNRLSAELGKDVNSDANISSNSANTLASKLPSNDWDSQNSFSKPLSRPSNANDAMVTSLKASNPTSQNSFYTAAGIPTPNTTSHNQEITAAALQGAGEGLLGSLERGINAASFGLYDVISDTFFDGGYSQRQKQLENLAAQSGLSKPYKYANYIIDNSFANLQLIRHSIP